MQIHEKGTHHYSNLALSIFSPNNNLPRHRWFSLKEGFSEDLVGRAIDAFGGQRRLRLLDPFAGSGTSVVAAGRRGAAATAIEVNPFLHYAAMAKCAAPFPRTRDAQDLVNITLAAFDRELPSPLEGQSTFTKTPGAEKWLFNRSVIRGYEAAAAVLAKSGSKLVPPLRVALLGSLMDCCNARRDGKCLRYKKNWQQLGLDSSHVAESFRRRSMCVLEDLADTSFSIGGLSVVEGDCRLALKTLRAREFDLVVTSPPYLNSFDYSDVYRPELFAGRFVRSNDDLRQIRLRTIRSHVQVAWKLEARRLPSGLISPIVRELGTKTLWDHRLPSMVKTYFIDMADVVYQLHRVVRPGGEAWIVVSTSAYAGIEIPVDLILADIAGRSGWKVREMYVLRSLRASGQHFSKHLPPGASPPLRESLLLFRRR